MDDRTDWPPQYANIDAVWLFEGEPELLARHRAARDYDEDGTHRRSRVCQECGWEVPIQQRALTACPGCGEALANG